MISKFNRLEKLLVENDYKGNDPFDFPNAPLLRFIPIKFYYPILFASKFGSRLAPDFTRKIFRIPKIEDPKTYTCSYFAYLFTNENSKAKMMLERLKLLANDEENGVSWGYDFNWPTMDKSLNPRRESTIVPGSFAMLAFIYDYCLNNNDASFQVATQAAEYYSTKHLLKNSSDEKFIAYFKTSKSNTHNANLLGCASMSLIYNIAQNPDKLRLLSECSNTSVKAVEPNGYINYKDTKDGFWTDCFHHLYVIASLRLIVLSNPFVDKDIYENKIARMIEYYEDNFLRKDGFINYFPGNKYPIDPHNYAATAIFNILFSQDEVSAKELLNTIERVGWLEAEGRFLHRISKGNKKDKRFFMRWGQAWMFLAYSVVENSKNLFSQFEQISKKINC